MGAFYTVANVPYGSLLSLISNDPGDRASLSAFRSIGSLVGNAFIYNLDKKTTAKMMAELEERHAK